MRHNRKSVKPGRGLSDLSENGIIQKMTEENCGWSFYKLEDLTVLKRSPDLLNNVKIGQDQLRLIKKHILFYGGYGHFG